MGILWEMTWVAGVGWVAGGGTSVFNDGNFAILDPNTGDGSDDTYSGKLTVNPSLSLGDSGDDTAWQAYFKKTLASSYGSGTSLDISFDLNYQGTAFGTGVDYLSLLALVGGGVNVELWIEDDDASAGSFAATNPHKLRISTTSATTNAVVSASTYDLTGWPRIRLNVLNHASAGAIRLLVDGSLAAEVTGVNTITNGSNNEPYWWNHSRTLVMEQAGGYAHSFDNIVVTDDAYAGPTGKVRSKTAGSLAGGHGGLVR